MTFLGTLPRRITTTVPESPEQSWPQVSPLVRKKKKHIRLNLSDSEDDHQDNSPGDSDKGLIYIF